MVAQIDEQHAAMVADAMAPAGKPDLGADVGSRAARRRYGCGSDACSIPPMKSVKGRRTTTWPSPACQARPRSAARKPARPPRHDAADLHTRSQHSIRLGARMQCANRPVKPRPAAPVDDDGRGGRRDAHRPWPRHRLCAAGRAERSLVRRAVPGLRPAAHHPHPPRAGRRLYGARRRARDRQAAGLCGGAGAGPAQFRGGAPHRLCHECAGAGADRANPACRYRPRPRPSA